MYCVCIVLLSVYRLCFSVSFLHAVYTCRFIIGAMKGFVPSFHGNELYIAVIKIIYHGSIFDRRF